MSRHLSLSLPPFSGAARLRAVVLLAVGLVLAGPAAAHTISGTVIIESSGEPAHGAEIVLLETDQVVHTDDDGRFTIEAEVHYSAYTLQVDLGFLSAIRRVLAVSENESVELDEPILLRSGHRMHERVSVTASASDSTPIRTFGSVHSVEGLELQNQAARNVAELLEGSPGIAVRSFGPGSARPVVRGFDGDRVLVMEDGVRTGDLGSQSADHGVPVDPLQAERVEVVRGPATLLYGSNAIGGAVNVISMSSHLAHNPPAGFRGQVNGDFSSADNGRRGGARLQASGNGWFAWGGGNSNRASDYNAPSGAVKNSEMAMDQGEAGFGIFGDRAWFSGSMRIDDSRYGVPFAGDFHGAHGHGAPAEDPHGHEGHDHGHDHGEEDEEEEELLVDVTMNRRQFRSDFGVRELGSLFPEAEFTVRYSDYDQDEIEEFVADGTELVATHFDNRSLVLRGELKRPSGRWNSRVGLWGNFRDYQAAGEEALAPKTRQNAYAAFAYNELQTTDRFAVLLGARMERNAYVVNARPDLDDHDHGETVGGDGHDHDHGHDHGDDHGDEDGHEPPPVRDRDFLAASGSAGARYALTEATSLVGTASLSTRTPSLEELYNFGPHVGNLAFEIGNPNLDPERSLGLELSLRHSSDDIIGSASVFRYDISDFIFGAANGEEEGGLQVLEFLQADAVYQGYEVEGHLLLGAAELVANASYVDASLTGTQENAPRIPPLGGQVRLDVSIGDFRLSPRLRWAARMDRLYHTETPTDGYAVFDFTASRVFVGAHTVSNLSVRGYNLTNTTYRHHTSLIKDLAAQRGRGFRISYSIQFF